MTTTIPIRTTTSSVPSCARPDRGDRGRHRAELEAEPPGDAGVPCPENARSATLPRALRHLKNTEGAAALRPVADRRAAAGVSARTSAAGGVGHQRRRDVTDGVRRPVRQSTPHRAHLPLQQTRKGAAIPIEIRSHRPRPRSGFVDPGAPHPGCASGCTPRRTSNSGRCRSGDPTNLAALLGRWPLQLGDVEDLLTWTRQIGAASRDGVQLLQELGVRTRRLRHHRISGAAPGLLPIDPDSAG